MKQIEVMETRTESYASQRVLLERCNEMERLGWAVRLLTDSPQHKLVFVTFERNR